MGEAADGLSALQVIEAQQPDVVILDLQMSDLGGLEVVRRVWEVAPGTRGRGFMVLRQTRTGRRDEESRRPVPSLLVRGGLSRRSGLGSTHLVIGDLHQ
jgi:CheY-like chemotaxis protein